MIQAPRQFEQDHGEGDGKARHTAHGSTSGNQRIHARRDTSLKTVIFRATTENCPIRIGKAKVLHKMAHNPSQQPTDHHRWYVDPCWYFDSKRDYGKETFNDERDTQVAYHVQNVCRGCRAQTTPHLAAARACQLKEQFRDSELGESIPKTRESGDQSHQEYLEKGIFLDDRNTPESPGPDSGCFDEQRTSSSTEYTEKYEHKYLEKSPVCRIADFEDDNFERAIGVQELERQGRDLLRRQNRRVQRC